MIELLQGFPEHVVALVAREHVTRADYQTVLVPAVEKALKQHDKVRVYYELGPDFQGIEAGAMWEDFMVGISHWPRWERIAVVTDVAWIRYAIDAFRFLLPARIRMFTATEAGDARKWIIS